MSTVYKNSTSIITNPIYGSGAEPKLGPYQKKIIEIIDHMLNLKFSFSDGTKPAVVSLFEAAEMDTTALGLAFHDFSDSFRAIREKFIQFCLLPGGSLPSQYANPSTF